MSDKHALIVLDEDVPEGAVDKLIELGYLPPVHRIVCSTCGQHSRRYIELSPGEVLTVWCCMGPGDPWLPNQTPVETHAWVDLVAVYVAQLKFNRLRSIDADPDERALDRSGPVLD